jgi:signal transduction histidine kinase
MLRKYLICTIFLFTLLDYAHASGTLKDSLLVLAARAEGHERIRLLNKVARIQLDFNPESSLKYSRMALDAARTRGSDTDRAEALKNIGAAWASLGNKQESLPYLEEALGVYTARLEDAETPSDICHSASILSIRGQFDEAIEHYERALLLAGEAKTAGLIRCLTGMGETYWKMGQYIQSLDCYTRSLHLHEAMDVNDGLDRLLFEIALNCQRLARYEEALRYLYESLMVSQEVRNLNQTGHTYRLIGSIYLEMEEGDKALEYHRKALVILEQMGDAEGAANALDALADIYLKTAQFDPAIRMYNRSYELRRAGGNKRLIVNSQMNLGKYYTSRENYPLALSYYKDALSVAEALEDKWLLARISTNLGELHELRQEYSIALMYLRSAVTIAEGMEANEILHDAYLAMHKYYKSTGDYRRALDYYIKYDEVQKAMINVESRTNIANLQSRYDLVSKEKEIERLEKENIVNQLNLQKERSLRKYILSIAIFLLFLGLSIAYALIRIGKMNLILQQKNHELEDLNLRLTNYSKELDELNQTKNRLISIISHDLKNPFHSLIGFSDLLVRESERFSEEEKISFYKSINETSKKSFELLQNLLDWTRLQTSEIPFKPADLQITEFIQSVLQLVNSYARDKGIALSTTVPEDSMVYADSLMFETVLRNIISNAIKYTPFGGKVTIDAKDADDEYVIISVTDTGVGMNEQEVASLFNVDKKASRPGTNNETGTGFGLILCREFVKKNGGELTVESTPGKGSTFSFTVPKRRGT